MSEYAEYIGEVLSNSSDALHSVLTKAIDVIESSLRLYRDEEIAVSFNGGKDATITLHLLRYVLYKHDKLHLLGTVIKIIYFEEENSFPEMDTFVNDTKTLYNLVYTTYDVPFKQGMIDAVAHGCRSILMGMEIVQNRAIVNQVSGMRVGDPYTEQAEHFSPSTANFPAFMRVYPIFLWSFEHVWQFLRGAHIPYCSLYDRGYTSIGTTANTIPNPALLVNDTYQAAYHLKNEQLERICRVPSTSASTALPTPITNEADSRRHRSNSNTYIATKPISRVLLLTNAAESATIPTCDALNALVTLQHLFGENILSTVTILEGVSKVDVCGIADQAIAIVADAALVLSELREVLKELLRKYDGENLSMDLTEEKHMVIVSITRAPHQFHFIVSGGLASFSDVKHWIDEARSLSTAALCNGGVK